MRNLTTEPDKGYESCNEDDDDKTLPRVSTKADGSFLQHRHRHGSIATSCHDKGCRDNHVSSFGTTGAKNSNVYDVEGDGEERMIVGLLAQEVRDVLPDAVTETVSLKRQGAVAVVCVCECCDCFNTEARSATVKWRQGEESTSH